MNKGGLTETKLIRMSARDKKVLENKAAEDGISASEYLRNKIYDRPTDYKDMQSDLRQLINEINAIGKNINQIAYNNNSALYTQKDKALLIAYQKLLNNKLDEVLKQYGYK